jgi:predicted membrane channel-forming protein YqfA (hemolysin III family)
LYVIVALIVRKRIALSIPLCDAHKSIRKERLGIASVLLIACIPLPIAIAVYVGNDAAAGLALVLGLALFVVGLIFLESASPLKATRIGSTSAEFKGACGDFLQAIGSNPPLSIK